MLNAKRALWPEFDLRLGRIKTSIVHVLRFKKATEMKLCYFCVVGGVIFKLYVPKRVMLDEVPESIRVMIDECDVIGRLDYPHLSLGTIRSIVELYEEHTETVRYSPIGEPNDWVIGEPYIPKAILACPYPQRLGVRVRWEPSLQVRDVDRVN